MNIDTKELFRKYNLKATPGRLQVYDILCQADAPITAEEVFDRQSLQSKRLNLSTVYRILDAFVRRELAVRTNPYQGTKAVFEVNRDEHRCYVICLNCHKRVPLAYCPIEGLETNMEEQTHYKILGHKLEIYGYCPECQKKIDRKHPKD